MKNDPYLKLQVWHIFSLGISLLQNIIEIWKNLKQSYPFPTYRCFLTPLQTTFENIVYSYSKIFSMFLSQCFQSRLPQNCCMWEKGYGIELWMSYFISLLRRKLNQRLECWHIAALFLQGTRSSLGYSFQYRFIELRHILIHL